VDKLKHHLITFLSISVFILLALSVPYLSYTWAIVYDQTLIEPLNTSFETSGEIKLLFADNVTSLKISGKIDGLAAIFFKTEESRYLVFNSSGSSAFIQECVETCYFDGGKSGLLLIEIYNGSIQLDEIAYSIEVIDEPPQWIGKTNFTVKIGEPFIIDLNDYFSDPEGRNLTYLATENELFTTSIAGSMLTLTPTEIFEGEGSLVVIASDSYDVTRQTIHISSAFVSDFLGIVSCRLRLLRSGW